MRYLLSIIVLVMLAGCGGGGGTPNPNPVDQPLAPISGVGHPADVVSADAPPDPPGTPLGKSQWIQLTITAPFQAFDVYCWNDAKGQYTFFWEFHGPERTIDALYTPGKAHEIHVEYNGQWQRYDLVAGQTTLTVGAF